VINMVTATSLIMIMSLTACLLLAHRLNELTALICRDLLTSRMRHQIVTSKSRTILTGCSNSAAGSAAEQDVCKSSGNRERRSILTAMIRFDWATFVARDPGMRAAIAMLLKPLVTSNVWMIQRIRQLACGLRPIRCCATNWYDEPVNLSVQ
jgi:hypothetical protein